MDTTQNPEYIGDDLLRLRTASNVLIGMINCGLGQMENLLARIMSYSEMLLPWNGQWNAKLV